MTEGRCRRGLDQSLLSGRLDRELTQQEEQRVRLHLEGCAECRALADELERLRRTAMDTPFPVPADDGWDERPRGALSLLLRRLGWILGLVGLGVVLYPAIETLLTAPGPWLPRLGIAALGVGTLLLLLSFLVDRFRTLGGDRYRKVKR